MFFPKYKRKVIMIALIAILLLITLVKMSGCFYKNVTFRYPPDNYIEYRSKDNAYSFQFWFLRNDSFVWLDDEWYKAEDLERLKGTMSCRLIIEGRDSGNSYNYGLFTEYEIKDLKVELRDENGKIIQESGVYYVFKDKEKLRNHLRSYDSIETCLLNSNDLSGNFYIEIFYYDKDKKIENMKKVYIEVKCLLSKNNNEEVIYFKRELFRNVYFETKEWFL